MALMINQQAGFASARTVSGHATAPPRSVKKLRRLIRLLRAKPRIAREDV
jgi:hypothetical protein